jgi:hypothetical protein
MTPDQMLDALGDAAALEHAHCVHYLRLHYALGGDSPERLDDAPPGVPEAADAAFVTAQSDMFHLKHVNRILVGAGREPVLDRAAGPIDLEPMTAAAFHRFPERELALADALDAIYAGLRAGLSAPAPPFTGALLDDLTNLVDFAGNHAGGVPGVAESLASLTPAQYLLVSGVVPAGEIDRRLLALSDDFYSSLLDLLRAHFGDVDGFGMLRQPAISRMDDLHAVNGILGLRGLLPPFTNRAR